MTENLPEHDHCQICDDPIDLGQKFCSEKCQEDYQKEVKKEKLRSYLFLVAIGVVVIVVTIDLFYDLIGSALPALHRVRHAQRLDRWSDVMDADDVGAVHRSHHRRRQGTLQTLLGSASQYGADEALP